ncbi:MAG: type I restriction-modification system subunit M N-terminal domain-containing protein [Acetobacter sp.]|nr:type I restriction-modification system subunit M N-terminal domain-containing protein [Acetobacter sp.]MBO6086099.1 type I restriction-modification system subunit M N-terminal domain-containing protein [Acetobacter sp.]MBO7351130.1 type I restriction-modification system subunit M N-terminal domain-containing protein [Acetobacter sp.]MBQ5497070.1 type I restriction-modification system subunit M N-terminal domain-containing protein [Acetobacter sp.]MBQ5516381.1 type I restriction-modification 
MSHTPNTPINTNDSDIKPTYLAHTSQREAIHSAIWAIADDLRGAVDGWDFKNYVLDTMFYRYLSENLTDYINEEEAIKS